MAVLLKCQIVFLEKQLINAALLGLMPCLFGNTLEVPTIILRRFQYTHINSYPKLCTGPELEPAYYSLDDDLSLFNLHATFLNFGFVLKKNKKIKK